MKYQKGDEVYYWNYDNDSLIKTTVKSVLESHDSYIQNIYFLESLSVNRVVYEDELFDIKDACLNNALYHNTIAINTHNNEIKRLCRMNGRIRKMMLNKTDTVDKIYSVQFQYMHKDNRNPEATLFGEVMWIAKNRKEIMQRLIDYGDEEDIVILANPTITEY
jgi:hypothetical protein